jgi:hypothetical protein
LLLLAPLWLVSMSSVAGAEGLRVLAAGQIDIVIGYCASAKLRLSQMAELQVAEVPREIAAGPEYGLAVQRRRSQGERFGAVHALARRAADLFPLWICTNSAAGAGALSTIRSNQRSRLRRLS